MTMFDMVEDPAENPSGEPTEEPSASASPEGEPAEDPTAELEPFEEGHPRAEPTEPVPADQEQEPGQQDPQQKGDETQFQYWQSQADLRQKDLDTVLETFGVQSVDEFQQKYGDINEMLPIHRYAKQNPELYMQNVERSLSSGQPASQTQSAQQTGDAQKSLQRPEKPTRPSDYDDVEAYGDPESQSYKYRAALENYHEDLAEYQDRRHNELVGRMDQEARQRQDMLVRQNTEHQLKAAHGFSEKQIPEFMNWMNHLAGSAELGEFVKLYKHVTAPSEEEAALLRKAKAMKEEGKRLQTPVPPGVEPGEQAPVLTDEDSFNLGLLKGNKRR